MKTYLLDTFNRYKRFSQNLDVKTILCSKSWYVFNDEGEKQLYIFQRDGSVLVTTNGIGSFFSWKYLSANNSILLYSNKDSFIMLRTAFIDDNILAFQLDGTNRYTFLIEENKLETFYPKTLAQLNMYFKGLDKKTEETRLLTEKKKEKDRADQAKALSVNKNIINEIEKKYFYSSSAHKLLCILAICSIFTPIILGSMTFAFILCAFFLLLICCSYVMCNNAIEDEKNRYRELYSNESWTKYL